MQPRPETLPGKKKKIRSRSPRRRVCVRGRSAGRGGAGTLRDPAGLRSAGSERGQRSAAQHKTQASRPPPSFMRRRRLPLAALPWPRPAPRISLARSPRRARRGPVAPTRNRPARAGGGREGGSVPPPPRAPARAVPQRRSRCRPLPAATDGD